MDEDRYLIPFSQVTCKQNICIFATIIKNRTFKMKTNYHTHTIRCQHATGSDEEYIRSAIKGGYTELGFADHTPWPYTSSYISRIRMHVNELPEYTCSLRKLKEKYKETIRIRIGLECEFFETYIPWLKETIAKEKLDYLIFGNHFYQTDERNPYFGTCTTSRQQLFAYMESAIQGMRSGLFAYIAHPDLFMRSYPQFDKDCAYVSREICRTAKEMDMPVEYNLNGLFYSRSLGKEAYPHPVFWEIAAEENCKAVIGVDAHRHTDLENKTSYDQAFLFLRHLHMEIVHTFPFFEHEEESAFSFPL